MKIENQIKGKLFFLLLSIALCLGMAFLVFGCGEIKEISSVAKTEIKSDCDCEKSNSQIRQENRTERKRLEQETKRIKDSLSHDLKLAKIDNARLELINQQLKDSLRFGFRNNKVDSKENVKIEKSNDKVEKKEVKKDKVIGKVKERQKGKTERKELSFWNWFWLAVALGFLLNWFLRYLWKKLNFKTIIWKWKD